MNSKGTYKYFENIIGWMGKPEIHFGNITEWRPKAIDYEVNKNDKWNEFEEFIESKKMKILFAIDNSGSLDGEKLYFQN